MTVINNSLSNNFEFKNLTDMFNDFSKAIDDDGFITHGEITKRVMETLDEARERRKDDWTFRISSPGTKKISFYETGILVDTWNRAFTKDVGFWSRTACVSCYENTNDPIDVDTYADKLIANFEKKSTTKDNKIDWKEFNAYMRPFLPSWAIS